MSPTMSILTRRNFLAAGGCAAAGALVGRSPTANAHAAVAPKRVLTLMCAGGWDTTFSLDPKAQSSDIDIPLDGQTEMFGDLPIFTHESRPNIATFFAEFGAMAAVINGIQVSSIAHDQARARVLTGNTSGNTPDAAAIVAAQLGSHLDAPYLSLSEYSFVGDLGVHAVNVGTTNQINALLDPSESYPVAPDSPFAHGGYIPSASEEDLIRQFVQERADRLATERAAMGFNHDRVQDYLASLGKGDQLRARADDFGVLGQQMDLSQQVNLALSALADELAWSVSVSIDGFDTHEDNENQGPLHNAVFGGLLQVARDLQATPGTRAGNNLLDETIIVAFSEMSRTPKRNNAQGKDHHSVTSALVFGGGVAGGRTYGGTGDQLQALNVDFATGDIDETDGATLTTGSFIGGVVQLAGGDASEYISNAPPFAAFCA